MQRLEAVERDGDWIYLFNGDEVTRASVAQDYRSPHSKILINGEPMFDVEYWVDGVLRDTVPRRSTKTEAVYAAFESGDWSNLAASDVEGPGAGLRALSAAEDAVRASCGRRAATRWGSFERMVEIYLKNHTELVQALDMVEGCAASTTTGLSLDDSLLLSQRIYNTVASCDSLRDQTEATLESADYAQTALKESILKESACLWARPEMDFLRSLRNASVHLYQVGQGMDVEVGKDAAHARIVIHPGQLLTRPPKSLKPGKAGYLFAEKTERMGLREFVETIRQHATQFASWTLAEARRHHIADLDETGRLQDAYESLFTRIHDQPVKSTLRPLGPFTIRWDPPEVP